VMPDWYPSAADPIAGIFVRDLVQLLSSEHDVTVILDEPGASESRMVSESDADVRIVRIRRRRHRSVLDTIARVVHLRRTIRRLEQEGLGVDLLHAHEFSAGAAALAASRGRWPVIISEHSTEFIERRVRGKARAIARWAFRRADAVCPVSVSLENAMKELCATANYRVVPNFVDTEPFLRCAEQRRREPDVAKPHLLVVALLGRHKGIPELVHAFDRVLLDHPGASLEVIGSGALENDLRRASEKWPEDAFVLAGSQPRDAVVKRMAEADLLVSASLVETFGIAIAEAVCAGLPVVATSVGIAGELLDEDAGVLVPPGDADALAQGITAAISRLGSFSVAHAAQRVQERYSSEAVLEQWTSLYDDLVR